MTAVTPRFGPVTGGTAVTITGTGFQPGVSVVFGPFPQTVLDVTPTAITLVTVPGIIGGCKNCTGLVEVIVQNPDLQQVRIAGGFTFTP
ncbi:MAG TPA: IPT/TIG domain-containing protein [Anaeromyxobacteraceae bacterium]|nr:IPT/TIG domain-containing protein [Anaeromyxobacteraceae bacterium]